MSVSAHFWSKKDVALPFDLRRDAFGNKLCPQL